MTSGKSWGSASCPNPPLEGRLHRSCGAFLAGFVELWQAGAVLCVVLLEISENKSYRLHSAGPVWCVDLFYSVPTWRPGPNLGKRRTLTIFVPTRPPPRSTLAGASACYAFSYNIPSFVKTEREKLPSLVGIK